ERRARPRDDLVSALAQAEEEGQQLSEDELVAMVVLLLVAGHETTVNLIGSGTLALLQHPKQLRKLRADPGLMPSAVEELLRFAGPVETATERYARQEVAVAGVTIPRGGLVLAAIASANRDERQFADPDRLDVTRTPNRHLSFGLGAHSCLGAALARMEGQIAMATLLRRAPELRLAVGPRAPRRRPAPVVRGPGGAAGRRRMGAGGGVAPRPMNLGPRAQSACSSRAPAAWRSLRPGEGPIPGLVCQLSTGRRAGTNGGSANCRCAARELTNGSYS